MLGKGAGRGFPGHSTLNPSRVTFSMRFPDCRPGGGASGLGNGSGGFQGWDDGRDGGRLGQGQPFAPFHRGFFHRVESGSAPPMGARTGQCPTVRS